MQRHELGIFERYFLDYAVQLVDGLNYMHSQKPPFLCVFLSPESVIMKPHGLLAICPLLCSHCVMRRFGKKDRTAELQERFKDIFSFSHRDVLRSMQQLLFGNSVNSKNGNFEPYVDYWSIGSILLFMCYKPGYFRHVDKDGELIDRDTSTQAFVDTIVLGGHPKIDDHLPKSIKDVINLFFTWKDLGPRHRDFIANLGFNRGEVAWLTKFEDELSTVSSSALMVTDKPNFRTVHNQVIGLSAALKKQHNNHITGLLLTDSSKHLLQSDSHHVAGGSSSHVFFARKVEEMFVKKVQLFDHKHIVRVLAVGKYLVEDDEDKFTCTPYRQRVILDNRANGMYYSTTDDDTARPHLDMTGSIAQWGQLLVHMGSGKKLLKGESLLQLFYKNTKSNL